MNMKRSRDEGEVEALALANGLMLLSQIGKTAGTIPAAGDRVFECKTCNNRHFPSFQALSGHRASHKKPKLMAGDLLHLPVKPKTHECSICGVEFALGQALGGHMRRHRAAMESSIKANTKTTNEFCSKQVLCFDLNLMPYEIDLKRS